ncbi:MAG: hypothetical protein RL641_568 [Candidatus Parcubacteria bacterium]|jgi:hypothetical protein
MDTILINWWAVPVAAVVSMIIGSIWYGPLFGKIWMKIMGMDMSNVTPEQKKEMQKGMWLSYLAQFVLSIITFYVFTLFIVDSRSQGTAMGGVISGLWIWLGFIMPTTAAGALWSGKPKKLAWSMFLVLAGYNLILYTITGAILGGWQ